MLTVKDIAWTAGFLEGEGTFQSRGPSAHVVAAQVQREPLERLQRLFGGKIYTYQQQDRSRWMTYHRWVLINLQARGLMMTIYGLMSPKRRVQINKALAPWKARKPPQWARTHCPRGHAYTPENTYLNRTTNGRQCKECRLRWGYYPKAKKRLRVVGAQLDLTES